MASRNQPLGRLFCLVVWACLLSSPTEAATDKVPSSGTPDLPSDSTSKDTSEIRLRVIPPPGHDHADLGFLLRLRALGAQGHDGEEPPGTSADRLVETGRTGLATVSLPSRSSWAIELETPGWWSPVEPIHPIDATESVVLSAWPLASLVGKIALSESTDRALPNLAVRFASSPRPDSKAVRMPIAENQLPCLVTEDRFRCDVPSDSRGLDLRLRATGFVSHFLWDFVPSAERKFDLGTLRFKRGGSVTGVLLPEPEASIGSDARVRLHPVVASGATASNDRLRREHRTIESAVNERGFFHHQGVEPGRYLVVASARNLADTRFGPITVLPNAETELREPLIIGRPRRLTVEVSPTSEAVEQRWTVQLLARSSSMEILAPVETRELETVSSGEAEVTFSNLHPGTYRIRLLDSRNNQLRYADAEILPGEDLVVPFDIPLTWIEGRLTLADEPVAAKLAFGGRRGAVRLTMESDQEGRFAGVLPRSGRWPIWIETSDQRIATTLHRTLHDGDFLEIELPEGGIEGVVLDERDSPVSGALVSVWSESEISPTPAFSDDEGAFELVGLAAGSYRVTAEAMSPAGPIQSETRSVTVKASETTGEITLVATQMRGFRGRVVNAYGAVAGARVIAQPIGSDWQRLPGSIPEASTMVDGRFELDLPAHASSADLAVLAPGNSYFQKRFDLANRDHEDELELRLEPFGGTLVIVQEPADETPPDSDRPIEPLSIELDGVQLHQGNLMLWARMHGQAASPATLVLPNLPPGNYRVCRLATDPADGSTNARPWAPASDTPTPTVDQARCASDYLVPGGESRLQM